MIRACKPRASALEIRSRKWADAASPRRILAIRLQAVGDVVITLPYIKSLRRRHPGARLDLLTRVECQEIPRHSPLLDRVLAIGGGRSYKRQLLATVALLPRLLLSGYDVVLDLQDNEISRLVRRVLRPRAWSEFDRVSPFPAGERTRATVDASGLGPVELDPGIPLKDPRAGIGLLEEAGWAPGVALVVLNPAGLYPTRNWPLENYVVFADLWTKAFAEPTIFLTLGLETMARRAMYLKERLGPRLVDMVGRTTAAEAFALLQQATLVVSEDSGLMHMAWVSGRPTLALLGSSRGDWSCPLGSHTRCLHSGDLPCRFCMEAVCRHGDTRCLTRYGPRLVLEIALDLVDRSSKKCRETAECRQFG